MQSTSRTKSGYRGGKAGAGVYQKLINQMPPHTVYVEAFLGHGAILLHKRPAQLSIGLDLDDQAVQVVRTRLQHRQSAAVCSTSGSDDGAAADILINGARYRVLAGDALDFLRSYPFTGQELLYADPPYLFRARRTKGRQYTHEFGDDHQHAMLIALLRTLPCAVMLSGYPSALYAELLADWRTIEFPSTTRGGPATEVVWMNYEEPTDLHEYTHLGANFRERARQKDQQARWVKKVAAKPPLEQKALLAGLLEGVGPTVSAEVLRSALAQFGDEALIARSGTSGSPHVSPDDAAACGTVAITAAPVRMSRCTICRHPARQRIDQALAAGVSLRTIAQQEGVSKSVLGRHLGHGVSRAVSHLRTRISGTPDTGHRQESTPRSMRRPYWTTNNTIIYAIPKPWPRVYQFSNRHSHLIHFLLRRFDVLRASWTTQAEELISKEGTMFRPFHESAAITETILKHLQARLPSSTAVTVFAVDAIQPYYDALTRILHHCHIDFMDGVPQAIHDAEQHGVIVRAADKAHWNETGHRIAAEVLRRHMSQKIPGKHLQ